METLSLFQVSTVLIVPNVSVVYWVVFPPRKHDEWEVSQVQWFKIKLLIQGMEKGQNRPNELLLR